ncbi:MAG: hypothetical protein WBG01_10910 [Bacteroidota bacterium]
MILAFALLFGTSLIVHPSSLPGKPYPGDEEFTGIDYPAALEKYDSLRARSSGDPDLLWRMARLYVCMGDVAKRAERKELYRLAEGYARECIRSDSQVAEGHTWLAASLGNIAMFEGSGKKVELSNEIQYELDYALRLNPDDDVAYSIRGSFYRALGNVSWLERQLANLFLGGLPEGGYEDSERALNRAIELAPDNMRHHFELGLLYINWDRPDDARRSFERALTCPVLVARDRSRQTRAKKWADSLAEEE